LLLGVLSSCASNDPAAQEPTATSGRTLPSERTALPKVGQCHDIPDHVITTFYDSSPVVSCADPHTTETVDVYEVEEKPTKQLLDQLYGGCGESVISYIGMGERRRLITDGYLFASEPSETPSWVRCDVVMWADTHDSAFGQRTGSEKNVVVRDYTSVRPCLNEIWDGSKVQRYVPCSKPHLVESPSQLITLPTSGRYPRADVLRRQGRSQCHALIAKRPDYGRLVVVPEWQSRDVWDHHGSPPVFGTCWYRRSDGAKLPPLR
jgi:hypothetical protein